MKALITGSSGFVGRYLWKELEAHGYDVTGLDLHPRTGTIIADLMDPWAVADAIRSVKPDAVFHLAGQADVGKSWLIPQQTVEQNLIATINLLDALREESPGCAAVLVGSSEQYGDLREAGALVSEQTPTQPMNPYAVSKDAQEKMGRAYAAAYGMRIMMTRSFNHGGAGQRTGFMIPDFASGIVKVERGEAETLSVGNLDSSRDFTHVKDIARAYRLIVERGKPGEVYNVGSGKAYSAREILDRLTEMAKCAVKVVRDPGKNRPSDTPVIRCDHSRLTGDTGWEPELGIGDILRDTLEYYRGKP